MSKSRVQYSTEAVLNLGRQPGEDAIDLTWVCRDFTVTLRSNMVSITLSKRQLLQLAELAPEIAGDLL